MLISSYSTRLDEGTHSAPIESEVFAAARMGDDSSSCEFAQAQNKHLFSFCFSPFSKAQLSVDASNDSLARD